MIYWISWLIMCPFVLFCLPTKVIGKKYLKFIKKKPAIYCCNHQTNNDVLIYKVKVKPTARIMAKKSLFKNKIGGWALKKYGAYPVERGETDITAVKTTLKLLKEKKSVLIFPEGTRVPNADSLNLKSGVVTFALKTDSYVVPSIFRKITKPFVFNKLLIGKPFKFSDMDEFKDKKIDKELIARANDVLVEKMNYLKVVDIKEYKKQIKEDCKKKITDK